MASEEVFSMPTDEGEEIQIITDAITSQPEMNPIERALGALLAFHNRHQATEGVSSVEEEIAEGSLNIFAKVALNDTVRTIVGKTQFDSFSAPLVNRGVAKDKIELLERLLGRAASQANPMTAEIIKDMSLATEYPPQVTGMLLPSEEIVAITKELCDYVASLKTKSQEEEA
jgi:hypothetical protein